MDYSVLIATISLAISLVLSYLEIKRRWLKLHFSITSIDVINGKGNEVFVILYLTFVNNSTIPKVIYRLDSELLDNYQIVEVIGEPDSELTLKKFKAFGSDYRVGVARFDDIATFPLDVEPQHSKTVLLPVIISPVQPPRPAHSDVKRETIGYFVAFDYRERILAKAILKIPV